jgi:TrmH family RNA methyltransferase
MFPLAKLAELPPKTRRRKLARIIQAMEVDLSRSVPVDTRYAAALLELIADDPGAGGAAREAAALAAADSAAPALLRALNGVRHLLLAGLHAEPSEWDLLCPASGGLDRSSSRTFPAAVYLEDIRSPFNVGSIFRTAEAFGVQEVILSPRTPLPTHPRAARTARGAAEAMGWKTADLSSLEGREGIFALEVGGADIGSFRFPAAGVVLLGSEELGLSPEALDLADRGLGRVSIPMAGAKRSLNVSVAFGILAQRWFAALCRAGPPP